MKSRHCVNFNIFRENKCKTICLSILYLICFLRQQLTMGSITINTKKNASFKKITQINFFVSMFVRNGVLVPIVHNFKTTENND